jgi:hypothetical protein
MVAVANITETDKDFMIILLPFRRGNSAPGPVQPRRILWNATLTPVALNDLRQNKWLG